MPKQIQLFCLTFVILLTTGCTVFGNDKTEIASYNVIQAAAEKNIEIREYDSLVLVQTPMAGEGRNSAFRRLFKYISGNNTGAEEISMTAPVLMDNKKQEGQKISMTAPVFMDKGGDEKQMMSFVLPSTFTIDTAPKPKADNVTLRELKDYKVAAIQFNGRLEESNTQKHKDILMSWISKSDYVVAGDYKTAGYDAPFTLPWLRRNEVIIPVSKKSK